MWGVIDACLGAGIEIAKAILIVLAVGAMLTYLGLI